MKPLFVLVITFVISLFVFKLTGGAWDYKFSGNLAMAVMLVFTAIGHFVYSKGMEMMLPEFLPFKKFLIYFTGLIEIAAAAGLMLVPLQRITAISLIVFFILILPSNIYASVKKINYQKTTQDGPGLPYLWFRIPLQLLFIGWVYFFNLYGY